MSVVLGFYQDANGVTFQVDEVAFHSETGEELVLLHKAIRPIKSEITYGNTKMTVRGRKVVAVPRAIFDNKFTFLGEDWFPSWYADDFGTFS